MIHISRLFGYTKDHAPVFLHRLENTSRASVEILDLGCRIRSIRVPDRSGVLTDVCLGYDTPEEYESDDAYFGAAVGRCANLIQNGRFSLNDETYQLELNDGVHHSHGGSRGFSFCLWDASYCEDERAGRLSFTRRFPHLSDGYPGNLDMKITYAWDDDNRLQILYEGICDRDSVLSVTNHTYFNLNGTGNILDHELQINADNFTEIRPDLIPTGRLLPVNNTPLDFRNFKIIGEDIDAGHPFLAPTEGYDHNFVLNCAPGDCAAVLRSQTSGIRMCCHTDRPGIQVYTAGGLSERTGKCGNRLYPGSGVCLETQCFTNAVNTPEFPNVFLKAGKPFRCTTTYTFDLYL